MDLSGNRELLDRELVAFFASRTAPPEALALATCWAHEIAHSHKVVISGFHSPQTQPRSIFYRDSHSELLAINRALHNCYLKFYLFIEFRLEIIQQLLVAIYQIENVG